MALTPGTRKDIRELLEDKKEGILTSPEFKERKQRVLDDADKRHAASAATPVAPAREPSPQPAKRRRTAGVAARPRRRESKAQAAAREGVAARGGSRVPKVKEKTSHRNTRERGDNVDAGARQVRQRSSGPAPEVPTAAEEDVICMRPTHGTRRASSGGAMGRKISPLNASRRGRRVSGASGDGVWRLEVEARALHRLELRVVEEPVVRDEHEGAVLGDVVDAGEEALGRGLVALERGPVVGLRVRVHARELVELPEVSA